ncbi:hypothetical protein MAR_034457 [Mya arenaria]|uniref:Uncharacterized protein n=1 Tax=Mya arenaria TaxID=6604 RepID=A0ABY7GBW6_MYAAR|nr:hypothetical protein MAR_034457 [Mya arenaria]
MEKETVFQGFMLIGLVSVVLTCDPYRGPIGSVVCRRSANYGGNYQWETCLTNEYIRSKSNNTQGTIHGKCACNPKDTPPQNPSSLPACRYSPGGLQCKWYRTCLQDYFSCYSNKLSEFLGFAESFCQLYETHGTNFNTNTQQWVDSVRKCFEVELSPLLRPFNEPSCTDISENAFISQSECFTRSFKNGISKCEIGLDDYLKIFATLKSNIMANVNIPSLDFYNSCNNVDYSKLDLIQVVIPKQQDNQDIIKASEKLKVAYERYSKINRKAEQYIFYPFVPQSIDRVERSVGVSEETTLKVVLIDRRTYDLNYAGDKLNKSNNAEFLDEILDDIESGKFQFRSPFQVDEIRLCYDFECTTVTRLVKPPPTRKNEDEKYVTLKYVGIGLGIVFGVCILVGLVLYFRGSPKQKVHATPE